VLERALLRQAGGYPEDARRLHAVGDRFDVIDGDATLEPGLRAIKLGGHTPGQMATVVETAAGRVCLASHAAYNYRNLEPNRRSGSFWDLAAVGGAAALARRRPRSSC
jgi:glyoxylase-like metal-dependent hydrolase (beta-lactamase superfamily II)